MLKIHNKKHNSRSVFQGLYFSNIWNNGLMRTQKPSFKDTGRKYKSQRWNHYKQIYTLVIIFLYINKLFREIRTIIWSARCKFFPKRLITGPWKRTIRRAKCSNVYKCRNHLLIKIRKDIQFLICFTLLTLFAKLLLKMYSQT